MKNPAAPAANWLDRWLSTPPPDPFLARLCLDLPHDEAQALREERAGILEHEAGFTREEAEARAGIASPRPGLPSMSRP